MRSSIISRIFVFVMALCAAQTLAYGQAAAVLANAGFEQGEESWAVWGDGDVKSEYYGVQAREGKNFLRLWKRSGWYQDFATQPGNRYSLEAFVNNASKDSLRGDAFGEVKVEWRSKVEGDVEVGQSTSMKFDVGGTEGTAAPADNWTKIAMPEVKAPAKATHGRVLFTVWCSDEKGGGCGLFDDLTVTQLPAAP
jgi:hypothetical protein